MLKDIQVEADKSPTHLTISNVILGLSVAICFIILLVNPAYTYLTGKYFNGREIPSIIFMTIYSQLWMLLIPIIFIKIILRDSLKNFGLVIPSNKARALSLTLISLFSLLLCLPFFLNRIPRPYSLHHLSLSEFIFTQLVILPLYYFAEEFFFRGFLFIGLWKNMRWRSVWVTESLFAFVHLGKPLAEIIFSIPVGLVLNFVALNTRSVFPAIIIHYCIGAIVNLWVYI